MPQDNENLKLRFKLKTGEEFEAQGDLAFISAQKEAFLNLLKAPARTPGNINPIKPEESPSQTYIRTINRPYLRKNDIWPGKQENTIIKTPSDEVWNKIAYSDGQSLIIRRKSKLIKPQIAALIILSANKILNSKDTLAALELSKSLKLSGYLKEGQRLDRLLESEIKEGFLSYEGSKRNRLYRISATGQAKAYTWAEKLLQEY